MNSISLTPPISTDFLKNTQEQPLNNIGAAFDCFVFKMTICKKNCFFKFAKNMLMARKYLFTLLLAMLTLVSYAEQLYINVRTGNDTNPGTRLQPLKTFQEAAKRVNANNKPEATTIVFSEGVYPLTETVLFSNNKYSLENRLVIRAEIMPDDPDWSPQRMPILAMIVPTIPNADGEEAKGIEIEVSHVTIEGLRFSGGPEYYYIDGKHNRRSYPVWRDGKNLDDLLVTQCLFTGDVDLLPVRVAVLANGHGFVLDHCVFYHCQNPVVFGSAEGGPSLHNAMRYSLVYGAYYSGVWTTQSTADDFEFHHNIIADSGTGWMRDGDHHFSIHDCILTGNTYPTGNGNEGKRKPNPDFLQMENVQTTGTIEIEKNQSKKNYLQLKEGSFGSTVKAGLFKK